MNCWLLQLIVALIYVEELASAGFGIPAAFSTHNTALGD